MRRFLLLATLLAIATPGLARAVLVFERPSAHQVFAARNDGSSARIITHGSQPLVAPDGKHVAFDRVRRGKDFDQVDLFVATLPGGHSRPIVRDVGGPPLAWSSDGRWVVSAGWDRDGTAAYVVNAYTGRRRVIPADFPVDTATFSPNGTQLVLAESYKSALLYSVGPPPHYRQQMFDLGAWPVWGKGNLAYETDDYPGADDPGGQQTYTQIVLRRSPSERQRVLLRTGPNYLRPIDWTASGRKLLVAEGDGAGGQRALRIAVRTGAIHKFNPTFSAVSGLSRDGRNVLGEQNGDVIVAGIDGSTRVLATHATSPSWTR